MAKRFLPAALAVAVLAGGGLARADELKIGDNAPKLQVKEFVKGEPVAELAKGKIYVVEFWATWCGPCIVSIPHVTELQKKHKEVTFIGVSVWERSQEGVKPFVEKMGEKMDYRVAMDDVSAGEREGKMAKTWMEAAGQSGIPTAFIVNGEGKIAWIGHPMEMDKPLEQIIAGKYDLAAAAKKHQEEAAVAKKMRQLQEKFVAVQGDAKKMLAVIDEAIAEDKNLEPQLGFTKFMLLSAKIGDKEKTFAYGTHLVDKVFKEDSNMLNNLAWTIVDPMAAKADGPMLKLALRAAERADQLAEGKSPHIADTLAKALFDAGQPKKALETQERAMKLAQGTKLADDPEMKERLEQYRKAAREKN